MDYKDENQHNTLNKNTEEFEKNEVTNQASNQHFTKETKNNDTFADNHSTSKTKNPKNKSLLHFVLGGISGGIVSVILIIALVFTNVIPLNNGGNKGSSSAEEDKSPEVIETLASEDADVATNIEETSKAVVGVINMQQQNIWTESEEAGTGSGIIYKKENGKAYVLTNHHVVEGAEEVEVAVNYSDKRLKAKVLGTDELTDLAVLQIDGDKITTIANMGSSKDLKVGENVMAIGNPLGMEFANTVTKGVISGLDRSVPIDTNRDGQPDWITEVIQTDAAINPGNSGGALVNGNGAVIGINSMKIARQEVEGIGFAIPVDAALPIAEKLETEGEIKRPMIGITTAAINQVPPQYRMNFPLPENVKGGMVIAEVQEGSPAAKAGLQKFDIITKINGKEVTSILELRKLLYSEASIGDKVEIEYYRDGKKKTTSITLEARDNAEENTGQ